ncbi:MAG: polyprenyl synthetase family protein [bacterium]
MKNALVQKKEIIDDSLKQLFLLHFKNNSELLKMISYAFFQEGKRLRPILAITINEILGGSLEKIINSACAIELFHVATLLLDDLPCMDDDDYRRNKLSFHKKFSEHDAILTSFGLCKKAFEILVTETISNNIDPLTSLNLIKQSAIHMGFDGVTGGQKVDLDMQKTLRVPKNSFGTLNYIAQNKTAKLFKLSAIIGTSFTKTSETDNDALIQYADNLGFAFQILDDLATPKEQNPLTFYKLYGYETSVKIIKEKINTAIKQIEPFGTKAIFLKQLALNIIYMTEKQKSKFKQAPA